MAIKRMGAEGQGESKVGTGIISGNKRQRERAIRAIR